MTGVFGHTSFLFFMGSADWSRSALVYSQRSLWSNVIGHSSFIKRRDKSKSLQPANNSNCSSSFFPFFSTDSTHRNYNGV